jgi:uncharacterized protein (TIGR02391 family)
MTAFGRATASGSVNMKNPKRPKPPRAWRIDDLLDLGKRSGVTYLKAIPVLFLERWVRGNRERGAANFVWTAELAGRLVSTGLRDPFPSKGTSQIIGALVTIQESRNLSRDPLLEYQGEGYTLINLPRYEPLLQEYRLQYCEQYPDDYRKLFREGEPDWGPLPKEDQDQKEKPVPAEPRSEKPTRAWRIDDLLDLGKKSQVKYLKAIPVLFLERWVLGDREREVANYVWTAELASRLVSSGLHDPFPPKGASNIIGALGTIQKSRNLSHDPLVEYQGEGRTRINLPRYEPLLQQYRLKYREQYPGDYRKLFQEGEPDWGPPPSEDQDHKEEKPVSAQPKPTEPKSTDEIHNLLAPVEQALREQQRAVERLTRENEDLQAQLAALQAALEVQQGIPHRQIVDEELRSDCAEFLANENTYIDAIRRASVVLEQRLRKAIEGTETRQPTYGAGLVKAALEKDNGKLVLSDVSNEQDGVYQLFSGAFAFVRNPPAHKKIQYTELEAWQTINLIDYLLSLLRQAKKRET